jgi:hypothetical protein
LGHCAVDGVNQRRHRCERRHTFHLIGVCPHLLAVDGVLDFLALEGLALEPFIYDDVLIGAGSAFEPILVSATLGARWDLADLETVRAYRTD